MGPAARDKTLAGTFEHIAELAELRKVFGKNHVVHPVPVLDLSLRDHNDTGIILQKRFPLFLPFRLECITGTYDLDTLGCAAFQQVLRLHKPGHCNRIRRVDVQIGIYEHIYPI
jgi:hypothetical protein